MSDITLSKTHVLFGLAFLLAYQSVEFVRKTSMLNALNPVLNPRTDYSYIGTDHPSTLPIHVAHTSMTAEWLDDALYGLNADDDWDTLFPAGNGWVTLGAPHTAPKDESYFVLSMYHQLHCLDTMRYAFVAASSSATHPDSGKALVFTEGGNGTGVAHHMNHCLQYLREAILCAADTTLEESIPITNRFGVPDHGATGMGMLHKCRDWVQVREYVEERWKAGKHAVPVSTAGEYPA